MAKLPTDEDKVGQLLLLGWIGNTAEAARPALQELRAGGIVYVQNVSTGAEFEPAPPTVEPPTGGGGGTIWTVEVAIGTTARSRPVQGSTGIL